MDKQQSSQELKKLVLDLTTKEGVTKALTLMAISYSPILTLGLKIFDRIISSHQEGQGIQKKIVEDAIKHGKENGVDQMEIKINNIKGFKLNIPIEDVKIDTTIGADDSITMNVKYK